MLLNKISILSLKYAELTHATIPDSGTYYTTCNKLPVQLLPALTAAICWSWNLRREFLLQIFWLEHIKRCGGSTLTISVLWGFNRFDCNTGKNKVGSGVTLRGYYSFAIKHTGCGHTETCKFHKTHGTTWEPLPTIGWAAMRLLSLNYGYLNEMKLELYLSSWKCPHL